MVFAATIMLCGASLFAAPQAQESSRSARSSPRPDGAGQSSRDVLRRLEVMRRVLVRSLNEARADIAAAGSNLDDSRRIAYRDALGTAYADPLAASRYGARVDYLPGYGAVFTLSVPVRVHLVTTRDAAAAKEPADAADSLWEAMERESEIPETPASLFYEWRSSATHAGEQDLKARATYEYDLKALQALKEGLAGPLARFAKRMALPDREWVGISVSLIPDFEDGAQAGWQRNDPVRPGDGQGVLGLLLANNQSAQTRGHRLVLQIGSEELLKLAQQDAGAAEVVQKCEVDLIASAISVTAAGSDELRSENRSSAK